MKFLKADNIIQLLLLIFMLAGCARPALPPLVLASEQDIPSIQDDMDLDSLRQAARKSLSYLERLPVTARFNLGNDVYGRDELIESVNTLIEIIDSDLTPETFAASIRENFSFYQSTGLTGQGDVLFTGYYVPFLKGSRSRSEKYRYPLYSRPRDMLSINLRDFGVDYPRKVLVGRTCQGRVVPYYTRSEIDYRGALQGQGLELCYLADPIDIFFLQIQGSGRIELEDGEAVFAQYQAANGRFYRSIGKLLVNEGKMDCSQVSLFSLRDYLRKHPEEQEKILCYNESYVFFRLSPDGPRGSLGEVLTPGRSIATDSSVFPGGAIALLVAEKPVLDGNGNIEAWVPFTRLVLNQDTGGAIKGPGRADIFWGSGRYAEVAAGNLKHTGRLFLLAKKRKKPHLDTEERN